jgi:hypothetical protein
MRLLEETCGELGLELLRVGMSGTPMVSPEAAMADADVVIGYGRSVLEGMAMGCAAYVWDHGGGDGWVTPETYPALEADGFRGAATETVIDADGLRDDLAEYRPELGDFGYELVRRHHSAAKHAEELVGLLDGAGSPAPADALETMGLLVRAEVRSAYRVGGLTIENQRLREAREELLRERHELIEERDELLRERAGLQSRAAGAELERDTLLRSRSWRLLSPLRRLAARLRRPPAV